MKYLAVIAAGRVLGGGAVAQAACRSTEGFSARPGADGSHLDDPARGPDQTYIVPRNGSAAWSGHDCWTGNFAFDDGRASFAEVEGYDAAGNRAPPVRKSKLHALRAP